jgi:glycerophosphoryl diester phosphodiesterase
MGRVSLIAHRGQPLSFPENSLEGFSHVAKAGTGYVETDIHITADGIPVLSHDANLLKLTGKQIIISDHSYDEIKLMEAGYPERFGDQFKHCRIGTLEQFADLIKAYPDITCFIELKKSSLSYFGEKAVDHTLKALDGIISQCVLISYEYDALVYARKYYKIPLGWVLPEWSELNKPKALDLNPEFLFVDIDYCPDDQAELWHGNWQWVAFTINSAEEVKHYAGMGIELLETNRYSELKLESKIVDVSNDF